MPSRSVRSPSLKEASLDATSVAKAREESMLAGLREHGLKLTPQRLAIVRELARDVSHPTAQELFDRLSPSLPTMSFATVYNTLGALAAAALCEPKSFGPGAVRFDPNTHPHHHAICDRCGVVVDIPVSRAQQTRAGAQVLGFKVRAVERIYRGVCARCRLAGARRRGHKPRALDGSSAPT